MSLTKLLWIGWILCLSYIYITWHRDRVKYKRQIKQTLLNNVHRMYKRYFIRSSVQMLNPDWLKSEGYMLYQSLQLTKSVYVKQLGRYFSYLYSSDIISRNLPGIALPQPLFHFKTHHQAVESSACLHIVHLSQN